jgi:hypothetical protein
MFFLKVRLNATAKGFLVGPNPKRPATIPTHEEAVAILICDRANNHSASDLAQFDAIIFFDEIAARISEYPMAEV